MKSLFVVLALIFTGSAHATNAIYKNRTASFFIDKNLDFGGSVYYRCDSVVSFTKDFLKKLGAQNINVDCSGGIDEGSGFATDVSLDTSFSSLQATLAPSPITASFVHTKIHGFDNCWLASQVLKNLQQSFAIQNLQNNRSCFQADGSYFFEFDLLSKDKSNSFN